MAQAFWGEATLGVFGEQDTFGSLSFGVFGDSVSGVPLTVSPDAPIDLPAFSAEFVDVFGDQVVYQPQGFNNIVIRAIWDDDYVPVLGVEESAVGSSGPMATCKTADVSSARRGDEVSRSSIQYYVTEVRHDGTGITYLLLSRDQA
jgi:hypothetical protein